VSGQKAKCILSVAKRGNVAGKWQLGGGQLWQLTQVPAAKAIRQKEII